MLTPGHLAASYLISQSVRFKGHVLTTKEVLFIMASGYVLDLDLLITPLFNVKPSYHHFLPTHTPLFVVLVSLLGVVLLKKRIKPLVLGLAIISIFSHLVFDDIGYWLQLIGLQEESKIPQIFWFYPFDWRRDVIIQHVEQTRSGYETISLYFSQAKANMILEFLLVSAAITSHFCLRLRDRRVKSTHARIRATK